jgi:hypothetical protein
MNQSGGINHVLSVAKQVKIEEDAATSIDW